MRHNADELEPGGKATAYYLFLVGVLLGFYSCRVRLCRISNLPSIASRPP